MKITVIVMGVLLPALPAQAQLRPGLLDALVQDSPFRAATAGGGERPEGGPAQFEFRGVVAEADGFSFSIYDGNRHTGEWVKLDEPGRAYVARRYDPAKDTLAIEHDGQTKTLTLKRARVQAVAQVQPAAASPPPLPTTGNATAPPATSTTNAQEAQRLQNIAEEIRRRRALRQTPPADKPANQR